MAKDKNRELTPEEQNRKNRVRIRLFVLLILFDVLLLAYLVYEMITIIQNSGIAK